MFFVYSVLVYAKIRGVQTSELHTFSQPADNVGMRVGIGVGIGAGAVGLIIIIVLVCYIAKRRYKGKKNGIASKKDNGPGKKDDDGHTKNRSTNEISEIEDEAFSKQY